ncbi:globin [Pseudoclavibacter sp. CFCC 13611]|uniref:globin n=1 Tax=Pseudoclavibacter sp. CFCC 13611 TaxID=2615178 RepID=UPI001300F102|nr:globin [Pseudoclavibacter sp. CFCC 13611]KAB1664460.1 globin [Pseudoclavibacter sp. CFCC 13611]
MTGSRLAVSIPPTRKAPNVAETVFDEVGGQEFFERLAHAFYVHIREDEVLAPMYPADDFAGAERRLALFLTQYWGGPTTYSQERGHPRLRMRHMPFKVNPDARDRWKRCMAAALDEVAPSPAARTMLWDYFDRAAQAMVNTFEE